MSKFLLALLITVFCWPVQALVLSPQMELNESTSLSGHLAALRDAGGLLGIEDVETPTKAAEFTALPGFLGAGYTADTYWLRFTLQRTAQAPDQWLSDTQFEIPCDSRTCNPFQPSNPLIFYADTDGKAVELTYRTCQKNTINHPKTSTPFASAMGIILCSNPLTRQQQK